MPGTPLLVARAIWTGSLGFGLVNVPVRLYGATEAREVRFHQLERGTGRRIRYKRVAGDASEEVPREAIDKGYEVADGRYVVVTPSEIESLQPGQTRIIEIEDFIDLGQVDPLYFDRSYYLIPEQGRGADRPYELLRRTMADASRVAIGRFVLRDKRHLVAVRPAPRVLVLHTMHFPDEVRAPAELGIDVPPVELDDRELAVARQLVDSLTIEWQPERYHDTFRERVLELIDRKARGEAIAVEPVTRAEPKVVDLVAALEASLEQAQGAKPRKRPATKPSRRRAS